MDLAVIKIQKNLDEIKKVVHKYNLENRVKFYGQLPPADVVPELFKNDILVLPSLRIEGLPMTLVEAMFAGRPVLACSSGGPLESIIHEERGFLCEPTPKSFPKYVRLLQNEKGLPEKLGNQAINHVQQKFSREVFGLKLETILSDMKKDRKFLNVFWVFPLLFCLILLSRIFPNLAVEEFKRWIWLEPDTESPSEYNQQ